MAKVSLTYDEAVELLQRAVAEKGPDYVYVNAEGQKAGEGASCTNFHGNEPGCIVGHVLFYKGVTVQDAPGLIGAGVGGLTATGFLDVDVRTEILLTSVQQRQDSGTSWGDALAEALDKTRE